MLYTEADLDMEYDAGYRKGYDNGYDNGYDDGYYTVYIYYTLALLRLRAGVTFGQTFHDAVAHIEDYYGEELVFLTVGAINDEQSVLELPEEVVSKLESEAY